MFRSPGLPIGPDVHMLRSDVDAYLTSRLPAYGVEYRDRTSIEGFAPDDAGVTLDLASPDGPLSVRARFVVDCSGHASFLARRYGLRDETPRCRTNTRVVFGHFRRVPLLEDLLVSRPPSFDVRRDLGTAHHCFDGGWIWVIRFDDGRVSVGAVLDRQEHPDDDRPAAEELDELLARFPTVREHLADAEPIRPLVKTGRVQFTSRTIVGERFLLAPHAAGFIDPLFSTGVDLTLAFMSRAVPEIRRAMAEDDFRPGRFAGLDRTFRREIATVDRIVHGMIRSFCSFELFKQYWRTWIYGSVVQYYTQVCSDPAGSGAALGQYGSGIPSWRGQLDRMYRTLLAVRDGDEQAGAQRLKELMDGLPEPFEASDWTVGSGAEAWPREGTPPPEWFRRLAAREPVLGRRLDLGRIQVFAAQQAQRSLQLRERYRRSREEGSGFHQGVDLIRCQGAPPSTFIA